MSRQCTHYERWLQNDFTALKKLRPQSVTSHIEPGSDVTVCEEMDEQWGYLGAKSCWVSPFKHQTVAISR